MISDSGTSTSHSLSTASTASCKHALKEAKFLGPTATGKAATPLGLAGEAAGVTVGCIAASFAYTQKGSLAVQRVFMARPAEGAPCPEVPGHFVCAAAGIALTSCADPGVEDSERSVPSSARLFARSQLRENDDAGLVPPLASGAGVVGSAAVDGALAPTLAPAGPMGMKLARLVGSGCLKASALVSSTCMAAPPTNEAGGP